MGKYTSSSTFLRDCSGTTLILVDSSLRRDDYTVEYSEEEKRLYVTAKGLSKVIGITKDDDIDNIECSFNDKTLMLKIFIPKIADKKPQRTRIKIV